MSDSSHPLILAIDTSGPVTGVALLAGDSLREVQLPGGPEASRRLLPQITAMLADDGLGLSALTAIAYGAGPGAFTGIRTSAAIAQGLGFALDCAVIPVGTLDALAATVPDDGARWLLVAIDARMGEIYAALYRRELADSPWLPALDAFVAAPDAVCRAVDAAIGGDWQALSAAGATSLLPDLSSHVRVHAALTVTAGAIGRLGQRMLATGGSFAPELALPVYVRNKVAQTLAERFPQA